MDTANNYNEFLPDALLANNRYQLETSCKEFCQHAGFEHFLLYGSIFTSLISPLSYTIHSAGKAARLKKSGLREIIHDCIISSMPLVMGNIDEDSLVYNSLFNVRKIPSSKLLSISYPVHFPQGKFALLYIASNLGKHAITDKLIDTLAIGNHFARQAGSSIIRLLESELEDRPPYLSQRERECLLMASDGQSPKDISEKTGLSSHTVVFYLKKAREKLHSKNIQGAVGKAILSGDVNVQIGSEKG